MTGLILYPHSCTRASETLKEESLILPSRRNKAAELQLEKV